MRIVRRLEQAREDSAAALCSFASASTGVARPRRLAQHQCTFRAATPAVPGRSLRRPAPAIVVFTGDRAYKLKKPSLLDFSTAQSSGGGGPPRGGPQPPPLAPNVSARRRRPRRRRLGVRPTSSVMRRLPADGQRRWSQQERLPRTKVRAPGRAATHAGAARRRRFEAVGAPERIAAGAGPRRSPPNTADPTFDVEKLDEASTHTTRYVHGRARLFETRVAEGWVCDGHGDLLADDVFCLADGPSCPRLPPTSPTSCAMATSWLTFHVPGDGPRASRRPQVGSVVRPHVRRVLR